MTTKFVLPMLIFGMVAGMSIPTSAETVKVMDEASSTEAPLVLAQTAGMERRQDRRETRQNCRQANGLVGADKRHCKQNARQQ
jgi:hypothetical protein